MFISLPNLERRERIPELMDGPQVRTDALATALNGLGRVHLLTRTAPTVWRSIRAWAMEEGIQTISVLDIGCGRGDILRHLCRMAERDGFAFRGVGVDRNPDTIALAWKSTRRGEPVTFGVSDALSCCVQGCNVVLSTLFLHHLPELEARRLLARMAVLTEGIVLVHDLLRTRSGYLLAKFGTRLIGGSQMVCEDGVRSIRGAFTLAEVAGISCAAGLSGAEVSPVWPGRYELYWKRPEGFYVPLDLPRSWRLTDGYAQGAAA